jgi:cold shock CspA family protein
MNGNVVHYNPKGFGFIYSHELKRRIFFHISQLSGAEVTRANQRVTFDLAPAGKPGHPDKAINVVVIEDKPITFDVGASALQAGL